MFKTPSASPLTLPYARNPLPPAEGDDLERLREPLERHAPRGGKRDPRRRGVERVPARQDLAGLGERRYASRSVHTLPTVCSAVPLRRRGVKPDADLRGEPLPPAVIEERLLNGDAALYRGTGCREGHEEAVTSMIDFLTAPSRPTSGRHRWRCRRCRPWRGIRGCR